MKTRRWIIVIALFVGFTALVLYHGWNLIGANDKIRNYLITTLRPVVGNDFNIKKLDISIGAIHLIGVNLSLKNNYLNIKVEDVRLGFNFFNLIKSGFRPQKIPQDIIFVKPQITFHAVTKTGSPDTTADSTSSKIDKEKYLKKIADFDFIKRITVSNGKISYIDSTFHKIILGNDINGWLSARDLASTTTRLVGKVFNSQNYNLSMTGNIDLVKGHLDSLKIKLNNYQLIKKDLYYVPDYFDISRGTVDGTITLAEKKYGETGFDIDGQFAITDGTFKVVDRNLFFDDINLEAEIHDWNCMITNSSLLFNGSPVEISGKIINILNPKLDLAVQSPAFDAEKFMQKMVPNTTVNIKGLSSIHFNVSNTLENPSLWGELKSAKLFFNNKHFQNTSAHISFKDSILSVNPLKSQIEGVNAASFFKIDFTKKIPGIQFSLNSSGNLFNNFVKVPFKSLQNSGSLVSVDGKGDLENFSGNINLQIKTFLEPDTTFNFNGDFSYEQQKFDLNINSRSHPFNANAEFDLSGTKVAILLNLIGLHSLLYDFSETRKIKNIFDFKGSTLKIEGQKDQLIVNGDFLWNKQNGDPERSAKVIFSVKSNDEANEIAGNANIFCGSSQFNCNFDLLKYSEMLEINKFDVKNILISNGRINLNGDHAVEANILFPDTPLKDFARLIFRDSKSVNQGKLYGSLGVFGTLKNPNISCKLDLSDLIVNNIGTYTGTTSFSLKDKSFVLDKFTINKNEQIILDASGNYGLDSDKYHFDFNASKIDINSTLIAMFNNTDLLTGSGTGKIMLRGSSKNPQFFGNLLIEQGKFSRFYFDRLLLKLDQLDSDQAIETKIAENEKTVNGIRLNQVLFVRNGEFQMQGQGFIPFSNEDSLYVELKGDGNILSILPELTTFCKKTKSNGKWGIRLAGSPENILISEGEVEFSDGYLRLGDVAPEIKDISMKAKLEQDGFLNVEYISGKIRRKDFVFRNVRSLTYPVSDKLQPFFISGLGLNLGVFTLETATKGIPLHIPGFMKKNEFGNYCFLGKNETEKFYFAGPFKKPYVRGKIHLQNVNFTFPFITKNSNNSKSDAVVSVLRSMEWDVDAVIGNDLHYQRQIPSGLDNVYLDVILDSGVGGLSFNGILKNKTFGVTGFVESSRGNVEYLNLDFQVTKAGVEFDMENKSDSEVEFDKSSLLPIIYAEARTTVTDSTGFPYYIYLTLLTKDPVTGYAKKRGRLGEVTFKLTSESSALGDTEGEILASLGYSPDNLRVMATDLIGISTDNLVFRPLFRPFERQLEQKLGLDMVRFSSRFTRNLIEMNVNEERNYLIDSKLFLLRSTKLMVGKYLADQLFLTYSGELEAGMDYRYQHEGFGISHKFGLEYRINPTLLLQMEYDYNTLMLMRKDDKRILLRHSFPF